MGRQYWQRAKAVRARLSASPKHYAFQAHLEFDRAAVGLLIAADGRENLAAQSRTQAYVQHPDEIERFDFTQMNAKLFAFWIR